MTFAQAVEPYINFCLAERQAAPSTIAKYRDCFKSWLLPWAGSKELVSVTPVDVLGLRRSMVDRQLSVARQYSITMCLKSFLKFSRVTLGINCLDPAQVLLPRRPIPNVIYLTNEEIQKVLDSTNVNTFAGIRLRALIELLLSTGLRISEALSVKREVFEVGAQEAEIVGKGKRKRFVFFSSRCRFWVREYLNRRIDDHPSLFVTTGYPVRPCRREDVHRFFADLKRKAGITKKLTPHILRHTFCTMLRNNGADISHIKDLAGHENIHTTARYYLGKDKNVLREVVGRCLQYGIPEQSGIGNGSNQEAPMGGGGL